MSKTNKLYTNGETWDSYNERAEKGTLNDEHNPNFLFGTTDNHLLIMIANGQINAELLAKKTLENRGFDSNGKWVGFK